MDDPKYRNDEREILIKQSIEREKTHRFMEQKIKRWRMPATLVFMLGLFAILLGGTLNALIPTPLLVFGICIFAWYSITRAKIKKEQDLQQKIFSEMENITPSA